MHSMHDNSNLQVQPIRPPMTREFAKSSNASPAPIFPLSPLSLRPSAAVLHHEQADTTETNGNLVSCIKCGEGLVSTCRDGRDGRDGGNVCAAIATPCSVCHTCSASAVSVERRRYDIENLIEK